MMNTRQEALSAIILLIALFSVSCGTISRSDILASDASLLSVQAAINSAHDGDTVIIPRGDATWSSGILLPTDKTLTIEGRGVGKTVIRAANMGMDIFVIGVRGHSIGRIEIENGTINADNSQGFRIHHMKFYCATQPLTAIIARMDTANFPDLPWGVVDNCDFFNTRVLAQGAIAMLHENAVQHELWATDAPLGGNDAVYVEDCTFDRSTHGNSIDGECGARYVFRHNAVKNSYCEVHSIQGNNRAQRTWEIYDNEFEGGANNNWTALFLRGGTGVVFNNRIVGYSSPIVLNNVRDSQSRQVCGQCDGTSEWDQNTPGESGGRCRDQIGAGKDLTVWRPGQPFQQELDPAFFWNNVGADNGPVSIEVHMPSQPNHIRTNLEYFLIRKQGYSPYAYPHPLRQN